MTEYVPDDVNLPGTDDDHVVKNHTDDVRRARGYLFAEEYFYDSAFEARPPVSRGDSVLESFNNPR